MNKQIHYDCIGTCSRAIDLEIDENDCVRNIRFTGGCSGNTQGVIALCEGMPRLEVIRRLRGIDCRGRGTSCPDQLARALS